MIDVKELRIGNWVTYLSGAETNEVMQVDSGSFFRVEQCPEDYNPIPITEKLLLECGFEIKIIQWEEWDDTEYHLKLGRYATIVMLDDFSYSISDGEDESVSFDDDYITSLHQLQNLYFALTKKELIVDL